MGDHKILGILGGMGPAVTAQFYRDFSLATVATRDQDHPHVIVDSDPGIPDRTNFLLGRGADPRPRLIAAANRLCEAGADMIVMPCNTASVFTSELEEATGVSFINWIDGAVDNLVDEQRPPVGILATSGSIEAGLYQRALESRGFDHRVPDTKTQEEVMDAIYGPGGLKTEGFSTRQAVTSLVSAANSLAAAGAESLVLGCTELPLVLGPESDRWPTPVVDPARPAIRAAQAWLSRKAA